MEFFGQSQAVSTLLSQAETAAIGADRPILISGPVGAGKTHLARYIHARSARGAGPFVCVDCGTLPELENVLFGHRNGAFTGAARDLPGRLGSANRGTIVLDDFERLTPRQQDMLHRVLVDGVYVPVGGEREQRVDVRFVATTNKDVRAEVVGGRLKSDFVSRLDYFELQVPGLAARREDIPVLCLELLRRNLRDLVEKGIRPAGDVTFDEDCWPALKARHFDDNVRGLDKLIVRVLARLGARRVIEPADIEAVAPALAPAPVNWFDQPLPLRMVRDAAERTYILDVCRQTNYNLRQVARILGISPKSLYARLKQYGIVRP